MKLSMSVSGSILALALLTVVPNLAAAQTLGTPSAISATVESCNGAYFIQWTAVTGATTYDIWVDYPESGGYILQKATANTNTTLHAADASLDTLFEIQACNASGCGALSDPVAIAYYPGCP